MVGRWPTGVARALVLTDAWGHGLQPSTDAFEALEQMQDTIASMALGLDSANYLHYRRIAPLVSFIPGGDAHVDARPDYAPTADQAEFVVAYCTNAVAQIEDTVGDMEKPFSADDFPGIFARA